ncbi:helix-turn-helix domain-containing protein [Bacillus velezensis]|uniref:helix-turn-helix domain-containing protein n=1 Tax=Bacillus amyloliquefaciens group TaxID=1938374 RepID=UPI00112E941A|nr:helix-turn-helix domain-containing protein [Bacillus velezensis]MEB3692766.1 helix-turn-helix domain-containing protein [Bacillus amyloliquefaciens]UMQ50216.1 helix-turn-helix transcriptional regulator [Bacillus velezensis]
MVDFSPLIKTLKEKEMNLSDLRQVMSSATQAKLKKNHRVCDSKMRLGTIEKICLLLDVPVEKVIKITKD